MAERTARRVDRRHLRGGAEREAEAIGEGGLHGAAIPAVESAPAGVAHRKVADEAYQRMQELGGALWEYERALETKNPALSAELRGIRGWLALAVNQIKGRFGGNSMSDGRIEQLTESATAELESVGSRLG